jgi:hypothetical protein
MVVVIWLAGDVRVHVTGSLQPAGGTDIDEGLKHAIYGRTTDLRVLDVDPVVQLLGGKLLPSSGQRLRDEQALASDPFAGGGKARSDRRDGGSGSARHGCNPSSRAVTAHYLRHGIDMAFRR